MSVWSTDPLRSGCVAETPIRDRKTQETRARITEAALGLFVTGGFEETTIDQIADMAGVNRRTVFRHFATKEAILFDHLAIKRDFAMRRLQERPHLSRRSSACTPSCASWPSKGTSAHC